MQAINAWYGTGGRGLVVPRMGTGESACAKVRKPGMIPGFFPAAFGGVQHS